MILPQIFYEWTLMLFEIFLTEKYIFRFNVTRSFYELFEVSQVSKVIMQIKQNILHSDFIQV